MPDIYDLIYNEDAKADIIKLFPTAKIVDASDYIHEGRFSVEIEKMEMIDYLEIIVSNGLMNISLCAGVQLRSNKELANELIQRLKSKGDAE